MTRTNPRNATMLALTLSTAGLLAGGGTLAGDAELQGELARLTPLLGTWQLESEWAGGTKLWSQAIYRPILSGAFVEALTFVRQGDAEPYQRYRTVLAWDASRQKIVAHNLVADGTYRTVDYDISGEGSALTLTTQWPMEERTIRERLVLTDHDSQRWQVWSSPAGGDDWLQLMDGHWMRIDADQVVALPPVQGVDDRLAALRPYLGSWEISARWASGDPLWSHNEFEPGFNGKFISAGTYVQDPERGTYQRYLTFFVPREEPGTFSSIGFVNDGSVTVTETRAAGDPGREVIETLMPAGPGQPTEIRQTVQIVSRNAYRWKVWVCPTDGGDWSNVMDDPWRRTGPGRLPQVTYPVNDGDFVASGRDVRSFAKEVLIAAPATEIFAAWATDEGWSKSYGPPSASRLELAIGGRYEWLFDGVIGSNGCQVLSYIPDRMISFSWSAPPSQPANREKRTWVVVELEPADAASTLVRLTHLGFGDGTEWDETYAYFDAAWERVLSQMQSTLSQATATAR